MALQQPIKLKKAKFIRRTVGGAIVGAVKGIGVGGALGGVAGGLAGGPVGAGLGIRAGAALGGSVGKLVGGVKGFKKALNINTHNAIARHKLSNDLELGIATVGANLIKHASHGLKHRSVADRIRMNAKMAAPHLDKIRKATNRLGAKAGRAALNVAKNPITHAVGYGVGLNHLQKKLISGENRPVSSTLAGLGAGAISAGAQLARASKAGELTNMIGRAVVRKHIPSTAFYTGVALRPKGKSKKKKETKLSTDGLELGIRDKIAHVGSALLGANIGSAITGRLSSSPISLAAGAIGGAYAGHKTYKKWKLRKLSHKLSTDEENKMAAKYHVTPDADGKGGMTLEVIDGAPLSLDEGTEVEQEVQLEDDFYTDEELAEMSPEELAIVCDANGIDPSELAQEQEVDVHQMVGDALLQDAEQRNEATKHARQYRGIAQYD